MISNFLKVQKLTSFEYLLNVFFSILGLMLICCCSDFLIAYLSIELCSLAFYVLASFKKMSSYSVESGIKYFIIGAIASALFLLGVSFIYVLTGSITFFDCQNFFGSSVIYFDPYGLVGERLFFLQIVPFCNSNTAEFGLTLILFSLFIKLALAPFHLWSLDVFEGSPTSSTFFFAAITKLSILILLIWICYQTFFTLKNCWQFYSQLVGILSIFVGSFGGLIQWRLKTLLAYSSTSHMGYILLAFSTVSFEGVQMLLFYKIIYMISSLAIWYTIILLKLKKQNFELKYSKELSDLVLLNKSNPALAFSLMILLFSIAGVPPLIGFLAKMAVFLSTISVSFYLISLFIIFCSVISTFYYIWVIKILYFENIFVGKLYYPIETSKIFVLSYLVFLFVFLFINPNLLYLEIYKLTLCFF